MPNPLRFIRDRESSNGWVYRVYHRESGLLLGEVQRVPRDLDRCDADTWVSYAAGFLKDQCVHDEIEPTREGSARFLLSPQIHRPAYGRRCCGRHIHGAREGCTSSPIRCETEEEAESRSRRDIPKAWAVYDAVVALGFTVEK